MNNEASNNDYYRGLIFVFIATLMFSSKGIFIKLAYTYEVAPAVLMLLRMLMALPFYLWFLGREIRRGKAQALTTRSLLITMILGFFGYYLASFLDLTGLVYLPANLERIVLYSYPSMVLVLSVIFLKTRLSMGIIASLLTIYCGLLVVFSQDIGAASIENNNNLIGAAFVLASAFSFSIYFVGSEFMMRKLSSRLFTSVAMLAASVSIILHYLIVHDWGVVLEQQPMVYGYALIIALFCTVIPSFLLTAGVSRVGAATGSVMGGIGPVATLIMAALFLEESISALQLAGFVVVVAGVLNLGRLRRIDK